MLLPTYAWFGAPAVKALLSRDAEASVDNFYQMFVGSHGNAVPAPAAAGAACCSSRSRLLMLWRLPDGVPALPAVQPALAISLAWLFIWPYELPWYDSMAFCLIALYPASRLDWLVLLRLTAATFALMPGNTGFPAQHLLAMRSPPTRLFWRAPAHPARRRGGPGLAGPDAAVEDGRADRHPGGGAAVAGVSRPAGAAGRPGAARAAGPAASTISSTNSAIPVSTYRFPVISWSPCQWYSAYHGRSPSAK